MIESKWINFKSVSKLHHYLHGMGAKNIKVKVSNIEIIEQGRSLVTVKVGDIGIPIYEHCRSINLNLTAGALPVLTIEYVADSKL